MRYTECMFPKNLFKLILSIVVCELAGVAGSVFTFSAIPTWYTALAKPQLSPPNWVFGPAWTLLYLLMGIAFWLVWTSLADLKAKKRAMAAFGVQLFLNALWSPIFFGLRSPAWALVVIVLLWVVIAATIYLFSRVSRMAMLLLLPYLAWVSFAMYLNFAIWRLN